MQGHSFNFIRTHCQRTIFLLIIDTLNINRSKKTRVVCSSHLFLQGLNSHLKGKMVLHFCQYCLLSLEKSILKQSNQMYGFCIRHKISVPFLQWPTKTTIYVYVCVYIHIYYIYVCMCLYLKYIYIYILLKNPF